MTERTPGPWEYMVDTWHDNELYIVAADAPQDHIGEIYSSEEDARLVAAAPEMLEALELARAHLSNEAAWYAVIAAINKAKGLT